MENIFIKLIEDGKINDLEELKKAYRKIAKKTHPDSVGTDQFVEKFMQYKDQFEEARQFLLSKDIINEEKIVWEENYRYMFFYELRKLDTVELPHYRNNKRKEDFIRSAKERLKKYFEKWNEANYRLFLRAFNEYEQIKNEKPKYDLANLRKPSLYFNIKPVIFNLSNFHITGIDFYKKQMKRNLNYILKRLEENNYYDLKKYLLLLIGDADKGPAVFDQ